MSIYCPILKSKVVYLHCQDCDEKLCKKKENKEKKTMIDEFSKYMNAPIEENEQEELTAELKEASSLYYNGLPTPLSDLEFDRKLERLKELETISGKVLEGSPTAFVGAAVVTELKKVRHEYPALSLDKVKYKDRENLIKWLKDSNNHDSAVISWKNDGLTVVATYDGGKLVQAVTRGDGEEGSDITHNAIYFVGLPTTIASNEHIVVRGEAVMEYAEFERVNALSDGIYENPRNLASATIQMLDANESRTRKIHFKAFELVTPVPSGEARFDFFKNGECFELAFMKDRFKFMEFLGFEVTPYECVDSSTILDKIEEWKAKLSTLTWPTDGLVISYNDMVYGMELGNTGHHFKHSIAMKWTDETKTTTIREIEWSVGKTGIITPVAIFDAVRLGLGSNVTRASLHNISIMKQLGTKINAKAEVYLANMIIPQLAEVSGGDTKIIIPKICPVCGKPTRISCKNNVQVLHCDNQECSARQTGSLMNTFSKDGLFIKGLGESQIQDLIEYGLVTSSPVSFYEMANEDRANSAYPKESGFAAKVSSLWNKDGWGKKKWENLINAIEASRETTLQKFLYSLNIPLLGNDLSKKLSKVWFGDINHFRCFVDEVYEKGKEWGISELTNIDGIGEEKASNIVNWALEVKSTRKWESVLDLIENLHFPDVVENSVNTDASLEGLVFVITGSVYNYKNRDEFKASVEARGGKVSGSVSSKTSFLVNNDVTSTSGKNKKAKELGIEIISEDEFISRFSK